MKFGKRLEFYLRCIFALITGLLTFPRQTLKHAIRMLTYCIKRDFSKSRLILFEFFFLRGCKQQKITFRRTTAGVYKNFTEMIPLSGLSTLPASPEQSMEKSFSQLKIKCLINRHGAMGDVLLLTPVIRALYEKYRGQILIDLVTKTPSALAHNPYVHRIFDPKQIQFEINDYDLYFDLNSAYEKHPGLHPSLVYARYVLGDSEVNLQPQVFPTDREVLQAQTISTRIANPFLVVHFNSHDWPNRNISPVFAVHLLQNLLRSGWSLAFVGQIDDLVQSLIGQNKVFDLRERLSLGTLRSLMDMSGGFLGIDSGPSHVAACSQTPMAVIYSCAHHETRKPLRKEGKFFAIHQEIDCYGCMRARTQPWTGYECARGDNLCITGLNPDKVSRDLLMFFGPAIKAS